MPKPNDDPILAECQAQKRAAWDAHDFPTFDLYSSIEYEVTKLRAVGRALASLYKRGASDDTWNAMFEALSDAGLLSDTDDEAEQEGGDDA